MSKKKEEKEIEEVKEVVTEAGMAPEEPTGCIICGGPAETVRFAMINDEAVQLKLCGNCYINSTLGEAVGKYKKMKGVK